ncbi:MAG TPA: hypothetical protein VEY31_12975 [Roseococcus sp.]|jgi:hypothetical protein|nr:hypothetical protein [Roseococcus sp.]
MSNEAATLLLGVLVGYGAAGLLVGVAFLVWGIERLDAAAVGAYAFRPLLLPGLVLLWPWVLQRWRRVA